MKKMVWIVAVMAVAAQSYGAMLNKGVREMSVDGSINKDSEMNVSVSGRGGYFIMDFLEVGASAGLSWLQGGDLMVLSGGVFGEYNLPLDGVPNIVPFCGVAGGLTYSKIDTDWADESDTAFEASLYGGAKYFLLDNLAIALQAAVLVASEDIYAGDGEMEAFDWVINMVTRFFF
jgi:hypothetical protein